MSTKIFVNLPVKDLKKSVDFFTKLGYTFNAQFTDESATCMIISEDIYAMLLVEDRFKTFIKKEIADATKTTEVLLGLSAESREAVDELENKAIAAGGKAPNDKQDQGFMYGWGYEDLDGHLWEIFWMDPSAVQ
jgi:predicted lactoylglutathione lyase